MAVNSDVNQIKKSKDLDYPCLMVTSDPDMVVLFRAKAKGVVVQAGVGAGYDIGDVSATWNMTAFKPFHGSITLSNE